MYKMITKQAYRIFLNILLSCRCPVSVATEEALVERSLAITPNETLDFDSLLKIAAADGDDTPLHSFARYVDARKPAGAKKLKGANSPVASIATIGIEDVLSHFAGWSHWSAVEASLPTAYPMVIDIPSWFVSHMLLPVTIREDSSGRYGVYDAGGKDGVEVRLLNLFIPGDLEFGSEGLACAHFASVVSTLTRAQFQLAEKALDEIETFRLFRKETRSIDYFSFQRFGNFSSLCRERYEKYFSPAVESLG
jgi:hypothetical protein